VQIQQNLSHPSRTDVQIPGKGLKRKLLKQQLIKDKIFFLS
jgi:hypothetical protein